MKKSFLLSVLLSGCISMLNAQDVKPLMSKSGQIILPEKGDWGLTVNAGGPLNYLGNMFNGNLDNKLIINSKMPFVITGKYFKTDKPIRPSCLIFVLTFINSKKSRAHG